MASTAAPDMTSVHEAERRFGEVLQEAGLDPGRLIPADGAIHRFATPEDAKGEQTGWAILHPPDAYGVGGAFGDWRVRPKRTWSLGDRRSWTRTQRRAFRKQMAEAKRKQEAERRRLQTEASKRAQRILREAKATPSDHPYLTAKGVQAHGLKSVSESLAIAGVDFPPGSLIVPIRDSKGALWNLALINGTGEKRFLPHGWMQGGYHPIGQPQGRLLLAEGYATAASLREATGEAVGVAFHADNLRPVAKVLREKFPEAELIICADDDADKEAEGKGNPGLAKACAAAWAVGGLVAVPPRQAEGKKRDFNDLHQADGVEAMRETIEGAEPPGADEDPSVSFVSPQSGGIGKNEWPAPQPLPASWPEVEPFEPDLLPEAFRPWIEDVAERMQVPPDFPAVAAMVALATAVGRQMAIRPLAHDDWTVTPIYGLRWWAVRGCSKHRGLRRACAHWGSSRNKPGQSMWKPSASTKSTSK